MPWLTAMWTIVERTFCKVTLTSAYVDGSDPPPRRDRRLHDLRRPADGPRSQHLARAARSAQLPSRPASSSSCSGTSSRTASNRSRAISRPTTGPRSPGYAALLGLGFTVGLMSLVYYDGWLKSQARDAARRPRRGGDGRVRASHLVRGADARTPPRASDRDRDRPAQLRRGACDRPVRRRRASSRSRSS